MTQKVEFTYEVEETVVLKQGGKISNEFCSLCADTVSMVSIDVLSLVTGACERDLFRLVESGTIFSIDRGRLLVCPNCYKTALNESNVGAGSRCFPN